MRIIQNFKLFESELGYYDDFAPIDRYDEKPKEDIIDKDELKEKYIKELGRNGDLLKYIENGDVKLTFGILKSLFHDAIKYKKKRELTKGTYKFIHRIVPLALAGISFPLWVVSQILGGSRAFNKILIPILKLKQSNYKNFLVNIITKTMDLMEGDIKMFLGDDWFYKVFMVDWGLIKMIRKEHLIKFAEEIAEKMEEKSDDEIVPLYYIENELRTYLNNKFELEPPLPLKTENVLENIDYEIYKNILINESIRDLLVGPTKEEIFKTLGYDEVFETPEEFFLNILDKIKIYPQNDNNSTYWQINGKLAFQQDSELDLLWVDNKSIIFVLKKIYDMNGPEIGNLIKSLVKEKLNWRVNLSNIRGATEWSILK